MTFSVGDRVRCVSPDLNAPVGIVGTVTSIEGKTIVISRGVEHFPYIVAWDKGQNVLIDILFPNGTPENDEGLELIE